MGRKLKPRKSGVSYAKWGYIFILPFFITYFIFTLTPQIMTIYNSFFENYRNGLKQIGPNFVGLRNYVALFTPDKSGTIGMLKYFGNTLILWVMGAVPQVVLIPNDYPGEVLGEIPQEHGTLETWHYFPLTGEVESGGRVVKSREDKKIREIVVYTPPGYDPAERYDLLLIAPGAGHTAHQWLEKTNRVNGLYPRITGRDLLDSMIAHGYTEPLIVAVV